MKLAKDEVLLKSWDYAKSKQGSEKVTHLLEVTNKRLVMTEDSNRGLERTELPLSTVKKVHGKTFVPSKVGAILKIILAVIILIAGFVVSGLKELQVIEGLGMIVILIAAVFAVILIIQAILLLKRGAFELTIITAGYETEGFNIGVQRLGKLKANTAKVKMNVHKEVANEILDELGAIIIENK